MLQVTELFGVLIEAKGPGYSRLLNRDTATYLAVGEKFLAQARRQFDAANGIAIKWVVAEDDFADLLRSMMMGHKIPIEIICRPMDF